MTLQLSRRDYSDRRRWTVPSRAVLAAREVSAKILRIKRDAEAAKFAAREIIVDLEEVADEQAIRKQATSPLYAP
jgi:hypothetical protein